MVEKSEFHTHLDKKANKIDHLNTMKYIGILHGHIKQIVGQLVSMFKQ